MYMYATKLVVSGKNRFRGVGVAGFGWRFFFYLGFGFILLCKYNLFGGGGVWPFCC